MIRVETVVSAHIRHRRRSIFERAWDRFQLFLGLRTPAPKIAVPPPRIRFSVGTVRMQKTTR